MFSNWIILSRAVPNQKILSKNMAVDCGLFDPEKDQDILFPLQP